MSRNADLNRIQHMVEAAQEILKYTEGRDYSSLATDRPLQHLIIHNFEILGEAASRLSHTFRQRHPNIPWRDMIDMRNRLIRVYFDLNLAVVWASVQKDLPQILPMLQSLLVPEGHQDVFGQ